MSSPVLCLCISLELFFFFQAEDGIRDYKVTGVQTCALPICPVLDEDTDPDFHHTVYMLGNGTLIGLHQHGTPAPTEKFSEFRVGLDHVAFEIGRASCRERV